MPSLNQIQIMGHLGRDPEVAEIHGGKVANFSVATSEKWKDKAGEWQERTEWHRVVAWRYMAEKAERLFKGALVYVEGRIETRKWQDKDGNDRYTTEIVASKVLPLVKREAEPAQDQQQAQEEDDDDSLPF